MKSRTSKTRRNALKAGFRSGLELSVSKILDQLGIEWEYESIKLDYHQIKTHSKLKCSECSCSRIIQFKKYTPDFILRGSTDVLEVKGNFPMKDRRKMINVALCNPMKNIIMVFQNPNTKLSKKSKKRYWNWAEENGFDWVGFKDLKKYLTKKYK